MNANHTAGTVPRLFSRPINAVYGFVLTVLIALWQATPARADETLDDCTAVRATRSLGNLFYGSLVNLYDEWIIPILILAVIGAIFGAAFKKSFWGVVGWLLLAATAGGWLITQFGGSGGSGCQ